MIVYQESCETFMADVRESNIDFVIHSQFQQKLHHRTSESEVNSWKNKFWSFDDVGVVRRRRRRRSRGQMANRPTVSTEREKKKKFSPINSKPGMCGKNQF